MDCNQALSSGTSSSRLLVSVGTIVLVRALWQAIYRLFFHPLAKYPGPLAAKLSNFYMIASAARGRATYSRYDLHQKYGKVVRTGPNELCFADVASIKDIYGQSAEPCLKAPFFYEGFTLTGTHSVFSATNRADHARMRRLLSHGFSQQGVLQFQEEIVSRIERYLSIIQSSEQPVELYKLTHTLYHDIISQLSFAKSFDILQGEPEIGARDIETYFSIAPLYGVFPLARYLPFGIFKAAREARPRIVHFVQSCINDFRGRLRLGTSQYGLLRLMVEAKDSETGTSFSDQELIENAVLFIIAGSGTSASTVLYLIYELGKRPEMQKRLEEEIRSAFPDQNNFPDYEIAANLVSETRRPNLPNPHHLPPHLSLSTC